ncbi:MAG TPA: outer membrane beta-barrel protein [Terriglobales bacterium]|nr:outer membrane beta-barrel protein [Terriglobales bacterium]
MPKRAGVKFFVFLFFILAGAVTASAQEDGRFDVSIGAAGVITKQSTGNGTVLNPTNSGAVVASFRYRFTPSSSLEFNYGHTRDSQIYTEGTNEFRIQTTISEYTGAYVLNFFQHRKLEPFVFVGAGALKFKPGNTYIDTLQLPVAVVNQTELAFIYGGGADYRVIPHVAIRLQYRGLAYKAPDFEGTGFLTGAKGHLAEPSIGVVFRF